MPALIQKPLHPDHYLSILDPERRDHELFRRGQVFYNEVFALEESPRAEDAPVREAIALLRGLTPGHLQVPENLEKAQKARATLVAEAAEALEGATTPDQLMRAAKLALIGGYYDQSHQLPLSEYKHDLEGVIVGRSRSDGINSEIKIGRDRMSGANKVVIDAIEKLFSVDAEAAAQVCLSATQYFPKPSEDAARNMGNLQRNVFDTMKTHAEQLAPTKAWAAMREAGIGKAISDDPKMKFLFARPDPVGALPQRLTADA